MQQPKFKFGDKVSPVSCQLPFEVFAIGYDRWSGYYYRDEYHGSVFYKEAELELYQEPQKKKLYAYSGKGVISQIPGQIYFSELEDLESTFLERAPEYDIEYPETK